MPSDGSVELDVDAHKVRVALQRLGSESDREIREVVKTSTTALRAGVRSNAPVRSGLLASTIRSRTQFTKKYSRGNVTVVGPARRYAWIVEHGSKNHNAFEGKKYIAKSEAAVRPDFERDLKVAVNKAVENVGLND